MTRSADSLARDHTETAINVLVEAMDDDETKYRIAAAREILDRGHGKPLNATISVPTSRQQAQRLAAMSDEELQAALRSTPLPQLAAPLLHPEEVEAIEIEEAQKLVRKPRTRAERAAMDHDPLLAGLDHDFDPLLD